MSVSSSNFEKRIFEWSDSQKRCYHRIKTGCKWHQNDILRFLTLGSSPNMKRDQQASFRALKERIKRQTPLKLYRNGYVSNSQLRKQYANKPLGENLRFDYIKIRTSEGPQGVLHILYFGDFLPQRWLKDNWYDITSECKSAYIRACQSDIYNEARLARYCVTQYCIKQYDKNNNSQFLRYSWSWDWVYPGFVKDWSKLKIEMKGDNQGLYQRWDNWIQILKKPRPPPTPAPDSIQHTLDGGVILWEP